MKKIFFYSLVLVVVAACGKDKFETKPQLKLISGSDQVVPLGGTYQLVVEYTDKEGDVSDSIFIKKTRVNQRAAASNLFPQLKLNIPEFPEKTKGEITVNINHNLILSANPAPSLPGGGRESDTLQLKVVVKDKAGNFSDTLVVNNVVVERS